MKAVLDYIELKKQNFSQLPFLTYLRDDSIDPLQRLGFIPCAAPFIMSFGELNKTVFRDESSSDQLQTIINKHTYEDDHHWLWFLEDIEKLGLNRPLNFREALAALWKEETISARRVAHELYRLTYQSSPLQKLVVIEAAEATGNAFLAVSSAVVHTLEVANQEKYRYFGSGHLIVDTGHTYCSPAVQKYIESIELSEAERAEKYQLVDQVFAAFTDFMADLLTYAKTHPVAALPQPQRRIGTCLLEAGLITLEQLDIALLEQQTRPARLGEILAQHGWVDPQTVDFMVSHVVRSNSNSVEPLAVLN
ncbi:MAG: hypothetical protein ACFCU8_00470 [Thermosynechococcaceae cyanobacterium]